MSFQQEERRSDGFDRLAGEHIALRLPFLMIDLAAKHAGNLTGLGGLAVVITGALLVKVGEIDPGILPLLAILAMSAFLPVSNCTDWKATADTLGSTGDIMA